MKRFYLTLAGLAASSALLFSLSGCEPSPIIYDGQERSVTEVEEIIADKLEVENPGLDLEVNIYEESED
jgi:hypothetical protein